MPLVIPDGFCQITWEFSSTVGTGPFATTCGVQVVPGETLQDVANKCHGDYADALMPGTYNQVTLQRARATIQLDATGEYASVESDLAAVNGGAGDEAESVGAALLVRKVTNTAGRRGRGRFFLPAMLGRGDMSADGGLLSAARVALQTAVDNFYEALGTAEGGSEAVQPVILHNDNVVPPSEISAFQIAPIMGVQRKRIR